MGHSTSPIWDAGFLPVPGRVKTFSPLRSCHKKMAEYQVPLFGLFMYSYSSLVAGGIDNHPHIQQYAVFFLIIADDHFSRQLFVVNHLKTTMPQTWSSLKRPYKMVTFKVDHPRKTMPPKMITCTDNIPPKYPSLTHTLPLTALVAPRNSAAGSSSQLVLRSNLRHWLE